MIHPSSIIEPGAELADGVHVGPFCHIGAGVKLGEGVQLLSHASVQGDTNVGSGTRIFPFASVGNEPQDLKYAGENVSLEIGKDCIIREGVTINPGTKGGGGKTRVGNKVTLLANSHVAHDCMVGDGVILSNNVMLAGHCIIGDYAIFGGGSAVHQFCRIGHHAFIGGLAGVEGDVVPFGMAIGNRASLASLNIIGMKRSGVPRESIHAVRACYKQLFSGEKPVQETASDLIKEAADPAVVDMLEFVLASADRALCTPDG